MHISLKTYIIFPKKWDLYNYNKQILYVAAEHFDMLEYPVWNNGIQ